MSQGRVRVYRLGRGSVSAAGGGGEATFKLAEALQSSYFGVICSPVIPHPCFVSELTELVGSPWRTLEGLYFGLPLVP